VGLSRAREAMLIGLRGRQKARASSWTMKETSAKTCWPPTTVRNPL